MPAFDQLRRLTEVSRALTYTTSLDEVTRLTVQRGVQLLMGQAGVLMLPDAEGLLHVRAAEGIPDDVVARFRAPLNDEIVDRLQGLLDVPGERFVAVPLVVGGEVTGLLAVALPHQATDADEWLLSALADQAAVALENARLAGEVRIEMEDRLRASEGETNAKSRALATLAHDIRTPLGAIEGYCVLLEDEICGPVNDRQRELLGRVRMSGRHLLSLLDNVMAMARLDAGVMQAKQETVFLGDVVREAVALLIPAADAKLQTLLVSTTDDIAVTADQAQLRQVLVNLIGNAVKFTPTDGSISITTAGRVIGDTEFGEIRIRDTGPGIPEHEHAAVFEPYDRSASTIAAPGVGLGLAISRALVEQMRGVLELESSEGEGTTFIIALPAADTR